MSSFSLHTQGYGAAGPSAGSADAASPKVVHLVDALVSSLLPSAAGGGPPRDSAIFASLSRTSSMVGTDASEAAKINMRRRCLRILGSRLAAPANQNEASIADGIKKQLMRTHQSTDRALRFATLAQRLQSAALLTRKWAILHFLQAVSLQVAHSDDSAIEIPLAGLSSIPDLPSMSAATAAAAAPRTRPFSTHRDSGVAASLAGGASTAILQDNTRIMDQSTTAAASTGFETYLMSENTSYQVPELVIIKDLLFVLQGIDGRLMKWDPNLSEFVLDPNVGIPRPTRDLIRRIGELGYLYKSIADYLTTTRLATGGTSQPTAPGGSTIGLVEQSFASALSTEIAHYFRLLAVLESSTARGDLTLRRLWLWTSEPAQRLRVIYAMINSSRGVQGGAMLSMVHTYAHHGDPGLEAFVQHVLKAMCAPLFAMIRRWVYEGDLVDPHGEFFVKVAGNVDEDEWWKAKYTLQQDMIPGFIDKLLARKILLIGKSLNFLRFRAKDHAWVAARGQVGASAAAMGVEYGDLHLFERSIDMAFKVTSDRLVSKLFGEFKLMEHLFALKRYLLMGQGDFILNLMEGLSSSLNKPASSLYRHHFVSLLETALRSSTAQFEDTDILARLDVRLTHNTPAEIGWDVFSLDYHLDAPINTVITTSSMTMYLKLFRFMWQVKRAAMMLTQGWHDHDRNDLRVPGRLSGELLAAFHACNRMWAEMTHFVNQVQYYLMFEVVECSWSEFMETLKPAIGGGIGGTPSSAAAANSEGHASAATGVGPPAMDMDALIVAHHKYLNKIATRGMLLGTNSQKTFASIFVSVHQLVACRERIVELARAEKMSRDRGHRQAWGVGGLDGMDGGYQRPLRSLEVVKGQMSEAREVFKKNVGELLVSLAQSTDENLRNLKARLNYNEYYPDLSGSAADRLIDVSAAGSAGVSGRPTSSLSLAGVS
ncbi:Spc98 family-domain-containing protein [Catenaria anguillulae PL171]|uniref:Spc98 family-domain-containing protein n=1 Tax=Catenaria anguillulae PL171 TaxID=765915 RepID=A0A1Y2HE04_9FUNG|nr:Spc98 family-domain-containing protein [Catenaria anguillulae PL171]